MAVKVQQGFFKLYWIVRSFFALDHTVFGTLAFGLRHSQREMCGLQNAECGVTVS